MNVEILAGAASSGEELHSLHGWLVDEPEFHGRVRMRTGAPRPGEMGAETMSMLVALGGGGGVALTAASVRTLGSVLITWLKARRSSVDLTVRRSGAEVTLSAGEVRDLSVKEISEMLDEMAQRLDPVGSGGDLGADGARAAGAAT